MTFQQNALQSGMALSRLRYQRELTKSHKSGTTITEYPSVNEWKSINEYLLYQKDNMNNCARMNRLFAADGKCFDVAIDHGFFNEGSFLRGIEDMHRTIGALVEAGPDAIQLTPGQASILQNIPGQKPSLVLRVDTGNVYGESLPQHLFCQMMEQPIELALRLDAACVVVNLFLLEGHHEVYHQCVENICRLRAACDRYGMPLMVEPLVMQPGEGSGSYVSNRDPDRIVSLVRQAIELGADIIKADPTESVEDYHRIIEVAAGKPVLVRGGSKTSDEEILRRTHQLMQQGAKGIVYGRNVIQHPNPKAITRALMDIVHNAATPDEVLVSVSSAHV
jgi:class I fructose-bisphosphate aldolase